MVIVSNGHNKFILAPLATELVRKDMLALFITGAYPTRGIKRFLGSNAFGGKVLKQLWSREEKDIPHRLIRSKWTSELVSELGKRIFAKNNSLAERFSIMGMEKYGRSAVHDVASTEAKIYHYRSGFGHASVGAAKQRGMITICDHSIANPEIIDYLVENGGRWPVPTGVQRIAPFWDMILTDIKRADYLVVNSDFVKDSFVRYGWDSQRIFVHYAGLDDQFVATIPVRETKSQRSRPQLLFAGQFSKRKGGHVLAAALRMLGAADFSVDIIAGIDPDMAAEASSLRQDHRVQMYGLVPRSELAKRMTEADIFLFPSLAEGSARVVFMALACGCYVITTPNSGSIVEDGVHGKLVAPGDVEALHRAVAWALANLDEVREVGRRNAQVVRENFCQASYGETTTRLYETLLAKPAHVSRQ